MTVDLSPAEVRAVRAALLQAWRNAGHVAALYGLDAAELDSLTAKLADAIMESHLAGDDDE